MEKSLLKDFCGKLTSKGLLREIDIFKAFSYSKDLLRTVLWKKFIFKGNVWKEESSKAFYRKMAYSRPIPWNRKSFKGPILKGDSLKVFYTEKALYSKKNNTLLRYSNERKYPLKVFYTEKTLKKNTSSVERRPFKGLL